MVKTFVALGKLRALEDGQQVVIFHANEDSVEHNALSSARVHIAPVHAHFCTRGVEGFVLQLTHFPAVNSKSEICAKSFHVKIIHPAPHLLIGREGNFECAMRNFWVGNEGSHSCHNLRDAGFVICTKQRGAISCYQGLPHVLA